MKSIIFTDQELNLIRQHYSEELASAEQYIEQVKTLLKKLEVSAKPAKEDLVEKDPKQSTKRGRKPKAKALEPREPKKRGRKTKVVVPTAPEYTLSIKPVKKEKQAVKVVPTMKVKSAALNATKEVKKHVSKPKKTALEPTVAKKAVFKKAPEVASSHETLPTNGLKQIPKKEIKKAIKKKNRKRKFQQKGVRLAPLSKPLRKKETVVEPIAENPTALEPIIVPTEEPKE